MEKFQSQTAAKVLNSMVYWAADEQHTSCFSFSGFARSKVPQRTVYTWSRQDAGCDCTVAVHWRACPDNKEIMYAPVVSSVGNEKGFWLNWIGNWLDPWSNIQRGQICASICESQFIGIANLKSNQNFFVHILSNIFYRKLCSVQIKLCSTITSLHSS